jgi:CHAD domain-containing protein
VTKRLAAYLEKQAAAVREGELVLRAGDAVSTHATRVAIRRYRSVLSTFPDKFPRRQVRRLDRGLRWYARVLGEVRDRQVLRKFFSDVLDAWPDPEATRRLRPVLIGHLDEEVAEHWAVLQQQLDRKRYRTLVADLSELRVPPVTEAELARALRLAGDAFAQRLAEAEADDADDLMHAARKAAKRARYVAGVVHTRPARDLAVRFARMQEVLGEHQDQVVATAFVARLSRDGVALGSDLDALRRHFVPMAASLRRQAIAEAHALGLVSGPAIASRP